MPFLRGVLWTLGVLMLVDAVGHALVFGRYASFEIPAGVVLLGVLLATRRRKA